MREYIIKNLGCPNCATKMETKINMIDGVKSASISFFAKKLNIEVSNGYKIKEIEKKIEKIIKKIEADTELVSIEKSKDLEEKNQQSKESVFNSELITILIGVVLFIISFLINTKNILGILFVVASYIFIGREVLIRAIRNIINGQVTDENFLMSIATIGALFITQYSEALGVMLFYQIGEYIQDIAVDNSKKSIKALLQLTPDYANLKVGNNITVVDPNAVKVGDIIIVKPGEKIPLDGVIVEGSSNVDTAAITGEAIPKEVEPSSGVFSGCINLSGLLTIRVTKEFGNSTMSKILDLVENATSKKAPTENFITSFAKYYTPIVIFLALMIAILPPVLVPYAKFSDWLYRGLIFLVISCPCAFVISIPLGFFSGIGRASKAGILIKGSNYLEALNKSSIIVFDKTGTLTKGKFSVVKVDAYNGFTKQEVIKYAGMAESFSNHPIAKSIVEYANVLNNKEAIKEYEEFAGFGVRMNAFGREILVGNPKLMKNQNVIIEETKENGTIIYIAVDSIFAGYIVISDTIKAEATNAIEGLKKLGIKTAMLSGDSKSIADSVADTLKIDEVYSELLPQQKVEILEELDKRKPKGTKILYVGDGINDAPVIARADIGIAMGGVGTDAAIEVADIIIANDNLGKIVEAINISKDTQKIVWQNIIFSIATKVLVLSLGALGMATIWEAVIADVGVTLVAVLNSSRLLRKT